MERLEAAILRTVLYADVFNFPMKPAEIHHFLIHDQPITLEHIETTLQQSVALRQMLDYEQGYVVHAGRGELIGIRLAREAASARLWPLAIQYGRWLARLPFVRMVALTGALAVRNAAHGDDDLDYLLITAPGRVWLARAFAILVVRLARLRGVEVCPNYVLSENKLVQERQNIFIAHEVAQMVPLYGHDLYARLRQANAWVSAHLPNAEGVFYQEVEQALGIWGLGKRLLERLLAGRVGDYLEGWEYRRKLRRFAGEMRQPHAYARLDNEQIKGHFNDHGHPVLHKYDTLLRQYGLEADAMPVAVD
jgi:hypothetical protein